MEIRTHQAINASLCGQPIEVQEGMSRVALSLTKDMVADESGLVHGGFIFGLADYAAMIAVNHPNVVLGAADVKFLKPASAGTSVIAEANVEEIQRNKQWVAVSVSSSQETLFQGMFTCFVLDKHIMSINTD